jgi:phosphoserine phosphatase
MADALEKIPESEVLMLDLDGTLMMVNTPLASGEIAAMKLAKGKKELEREDYAKGMDDYVKGAVGGAMGGEIALDSVVFKPFMGEMGSENYANTRLHNIMGFFKVNEKEIQEATASFVKKYESPGNRECVDIIRKTGKQKKTVILTGSPSAFAKVAADHFKPDYLVCPNETKYNEDRTVKGLDVKITTPQKRLEYAKAKAKELSSDLKRWIYVTNNDDDAIFQGEVMLLVGYGEGSIKNHCDLHVKNFIDFKEKINKFTASYRANNAAA